MSRRKVDVDKLITHILNRVPEGMTFGKELFVRLVEEAIETPQFMWCEGYWGHHPGTLTYECPFCGRRIASLDETSLPKECNCGAKLSAPVTDIRDLRRWLSDNFRSE